MKRVPDPMLSSFLGHYELVGIAVLGALAHLCLKQGAVRRKAAWHSLFLQPWTVLGVALMGAGVILTSLMLRKYPLTLVMPLTALIYIFVPLGSMLFLKEQQRPQFWAGAVFIVTGIAIISGTQ